MQGHHFVEQPPKRCQCRNNRFMRRVTLAYDRADCRLLAARVLMTALTTPAQYAEWGVNVVTNALVTDITVTIIK